MTSGAESGTEPLEAFTFLMCSERSGGNLTTQLLNAHPEVCGPSPTHLFRVLARGLFRYGDLDRDESWAALTDDAARLLAAQLGVWRRRLSADEIRAAAPERSLAAVLRTIYGAEAASHGKRRLFIKENHVHEYFAFLEAAFPRAKYVCVVRDPRDMALSWKRAPALRGGVVRAADVWREDQQGFLRMAGLLGPCGRILILRYETLITDPAAVLSRVCELIGVPFSESLTSFHEDTLTRRNAERVSGWSNLGRPLMESNLGKFRGELSAAEIRYVEARCADEMGAFGYLPEVHDATTDLRSLERELRPHEPWEKRAYQELGEEERRAHSRWREARERIEARRPDLEVL